MTGIPVCSKVEYNKENKIRKEVVKMKVGFIGLGIMGRPMAKNMLKAGVDLLVADLNEEAVADVVAAGAAKADYAEIGRASCRERV